MGKSLSFLKDGTHGTHADADDGPLLLSAKNIKDGTIKWDETDRRISLEEYEKIHSNFSLKAGDILLTIVGSIGETAILKDSEGLTFQRSVAFLRPKEDILSDFLYEEIQTPTFQKELDSRKSTSAQPGIYLGDLAEIPVSYSPSLDEQSKIGEYFLSLDNLITLHQSKYICTIIDGAKQFAYQTVDTTLVLRNWYIGKRIDEEVLEGKDRAKYGAEVIDKLSKELTGIYGKGYSKRILYQCLKVYRTFLEIVNEARSQLLSNGKINEEGRLLYRSCFLQLYIKVLCSY